MFRITTCRSNSARPAAAAAVLVAAALTGVACSAFSPEAREARELGMILASEASQAASLAAKEQQVIGAVKSWGGMIGFAGVFGDATRKAQEAQSMNGEVTAIANEYGRILTKLNGIHPTSAPVQVPATQVKEFLRQRVDYLTGISSLLTAAAGRLPAYQQAWNGSYPSEVGQINRQLGSYAPPPDVIARTLNDLRIQYKLTDSDLK